jgi:hypothetical protein
VHRRRYSSIAAVKNPVARIIVRQKPESIMRRIG